MLPAELSYPFTGRKVTNGREGREAQTTVHWINLKVHSSIGSICFTAFFFLPGFLLWDGHQGPISTGRGCQGAVSQSLSLLVRWDAAPRPCCGLRQAGSAALLADSETLLTEDTLRARGWVGNIIVPRGASRSCQISPEVELPRYSQGRRPLPSRTWTWHPSCSTSTLMTSWWPCMAARCSGVYPQPERASTSRASPACRAAAASSCRPGPSPCLASQ